MTAPTEPISGGGSLKVASHIQLVRAGLSGALLQVAAIALSTPVVAALLRPGVGGATAPEDVVHALSLTYLLLAIGIAFTKNRFVDSTAKAIAAASRRLNKSDPGAAAGGLLLCLWFAAVGMATMTITPSPASIHVDGWLSGYFDPSTLLWSATTSVGVAAFGANAQAANRTQKEAAGR